MDFFRFTKHYLTHWTRLKVFELVMYILLSVFLVSQGFVVSKWQWWFIVIFIIVIQIVTRLRAYED